MTHQLFRQRLELATRGQASNTTGFDQRKGLITRSVVHSVLTRGRRLLSSQGKQIDNIVLVKMLLGYEQLSEDIAALKYGGEMEGEAREQYIKIQGKKLEHAQKQHIPFAIWLIAAVNLHRTFSVEIKGNMIDSNQI